jgi:hypothetical protein
MKYLILTMMVVQLMMGCTKDIKTFDGKPQVYFLYAAQPKESFNDILLDSTIFTFAFTPSNVLDSIILVPVKVSGVSMNRDRSYVLRVNDSSTAKAGQHYEIIKSDFTISAGNFTDTVYIRLKRTPEMLTTSFNIYLELQANENFSIDLTKKLTAAGGNKTVSTIWHRVMVNDILRKPTYWLDGYLGVFSRKKLYLMCGLLGITVDRLNTSVPIAELQYYGRFMQRYLNEQRAFGNIIKEEDGTDMIMGPSVQ